MRKTVTLQPGESKEVVFPFTPTEPGVHQVTVDGVSGSFIAVLPLEVIDGEILNSYVWWNGLDGMREITQDNTWPVGQQLTLSFKIRNKGNMATDFEVRNAFGSSNTITLAPGETGIAQLEGSWWDKGLIIIGSTLYANNEAIYTTPAFRINFV